MAENSSTAPGMATGNTYAGSSGNDSFTAGGGNDIVNAGAGDDRIAGDGPLPGQWTYEVYTRDFGGTNQTGTISTGTLRGTGYVDDFNVLALRNTLAGSAQGTNQDDFGVIYKSTLNIGSTGTYSFGVTSDDGSRIIIRDSSGNIVFNLDNDREQGATTANGSVTLQGSQSYTIELYYWENLGDTAFGATIAGPGLGTADLSTSSLVGTPPPAAGHVDGSDTLYGQGGNDTISGGGGADTIYGGTDADSVSGEGGNDRLFGEDGNDRLYGDTGNDSLFGGLGDDRLFGGSGADSLNGDAGNDFLDGGSNSDTLSGGDGDDTILAGTEDDTVYGGAGSDVIDGGDGRDFILFGAGNDTIYGGSGDDYIDDIEWQRFSGTNLVYGGDGSDRVYTGFDADTAYGGAGADTISGEEGNDLIFGGAGADQLFGEDDRDTFVMQDGDFTQGDYVDGGSGGDDFDILDLSGYGWARTDIEYTSSDGESGVVTFYDADGVVLGTMTFTEIEQVIPCFASGTLIDTPSGARPVESLQPGDLVVTLDDGPQPVRWVGQRRLGLADLVADPSLQPVEIGARAFGPNLPERAIRVSPQHRVLFGGAVCELHFGTDEVLVPAIQLVGQRDVSQRLAPVTYVHVMFDRHQIVRTHGLWSESYQPGKRTLEGMPDPQREELLRLFPELSSPGSYPAARMTLKGFETKVLLMS